jgi:hypothetical protein
LVQTLLAIGERTKVSLPSVLWLMSEVETRDKTEGGPEQSDSG